MEWFCPDCGTKNTGKFCSECAAQRPCLPENSEWYCPECGTKNNGNFCGNCALRKPDDLNSGYLQSAGRDLSRQAGAAPVGFTEPSSKTGNSSKDPGSAMTVGGTVSVSGSGTAGDMGITSDRGYKIAETEGGSEKSVISERSGENGHILRENLYVPGSMPPSDSFGVTGGNTLISESEQPDGTQMSKDDFLQRMSSDSSAGKNAGGDMLTQSSLNLNGQVNLSKYPGSGVSKSGGTDFHENIPGISGNIDAGGFSSDSQAEKTGHQARSERPLGMNGEFETGDVSPNMGGESFVPQENPESANQSEIKPDGGKRRGYKWNWIDNLLVCGMILTAAAIVFTIYHYGGDSEVGETSPSAVQTENTPGTVSEITQSETPASYPQSSSPETQSKSETDTSASQTSAPVSGESSATADSPSSSVAGQGVFRGEWTAGKEYKAGDSVLFNGEYFLCLKDHTPGGGMDPVWSIANGFGDHWKRMED